MAKKRPALATADSDIVRLHITPLTAETASSILPPGTDLLTVSYHTLETFPESPFGFVDLPVAAAEKLKKKLRGALFRGVKVRVEDARPEDWKEQETEEERRERKRVKRERKREEGVVPAIQLPDERRVARGWVGKTDKDRKKEKRGECLFKAAIPANKADLVKKNKEKKDKTKEEKALEKAEKKEMKGEKKKKKKLIKEFENTQKFPSFLKESQLDPTRRSADLVGEFVEEVGWVDGKGEVVEQPVKRKKPKKEKKALETSPPVVAKGKKPKKEKKALETSPPVVAKEAVAIFDEMEVDGADAASLSSEEAFYDVPEYHQASPIAKEEVAENSETLNAEPNAPEEPVVAPSESEAGADDSSDEEEPATSEHAIPQASTAVPKATTTTAPLPPSEAGPAIHPLEALYKPTALTLDTSVPSTSASGFKFSFSTGNSDDDSDGAQPVAAPYRSSAPTPDTAIGNKRFFSPTSFTSSKDATFVPSTPSAPVSHVSSSDAPLLFLHEDSRFLKGLSLWQHLPTPRALKPKEEEDGTDMAELWKKRFYEQRGEWNREWKRRRREGLKQKRKRERNGPHGASGASGANRM